MSEKSGFHQPSWDQIYSDASLSYATSQRATALGVSSDTQSFFLCPSSRWGHSAHLVHPPVGSKICAPFSPIFIILHQFGAREEIKPPLYYIQHDNSPGKDHHHFGHQGQKTQPYPDISNMTQTTENQSINQFCKLSTRNLVPSNGVGHQKSGAPKRVAPEYMWH